MASIKKRNGNYYIRFFKSVDGKGKRKALSLGTSIKREAEKLLHEYEDRFERGEIDPFNGWTPKQEAERKRQQLAGRYMSLEAATEQFIEKRTQANETSKKNYRRHLDMLMDVLGKTMPVTQILEKDIREFCFRADIKKTTQASYLRHLKVFFRWLYQEKILKEDITSNIKAPKAPQKIDQKTLSRKELGNIFEAFDLFYKEQSKKRHVTKPHQKRLWFKPMIYTVYYCGLRAKEAVNLTWSQVDLNEGFIRIVNSDMNTTKSGKDRTIPIRKELRPWLEQWYKDQEKPSEGYVFPSATGMHHWHKMDSKALSKSFKKFVKLAKKVPNTVTLHGLRHSCATDLIRKGVPITQVSKFLGHSSVQVTQIYEHLDETDLKKTLDEIE